MSQVYVDTPYTIFQREFSHNSYYVTQRLFSQYMIWSSLDIVFQCEFGHNSYYIIWIWSSWDIVFQCEFSCDGYYIIQRLYFHIWYGHHQASFWFCIKLWRIQNSCQHFMFRFIIFSKNGSGCKLNHLNQRRSPNILITDWSTFRATVKNLNFPLWL